MVYSTFSGERIGIPTRITTQCTNASLNKLGERDGVLIMDEIGFLRKGEYSAGVQRQYGGADGRIENRRIGAFRSSTLASGVR